MPGIALRRPSGSRSCGCVATERIVALNLRHGHTRGGGHTPEHQSWRSMRRRCTDQGFHAYARYGGRGIKVCERWDTSFENFLADMGPRPADTTLDRIDPDGDYEPGNCRWSTMREQCATRCATWWAEVNGRRVIVSEECARRGLRYETVSHRVRVLGLSLEAVLAMPRGSRM